MKRSFMNNLKNFVDSNVLHRVDRVAHNNGNNNTSDLLSDELLIVERHFEDIRLVCVDAEKKISLMLQSIHLSSTTPSHLGAYTQNVQAGLNNLSHNIAQQAANITSANNHQQATSDNARNNDNTSKNSSSTSNIESKSFLSTGNQTQQYHSSESLSNVGNNLCGNQQVVQSHRISGSNSHLTIDKQQLGSDILQKFKKLPIVSFYKFLVKSSSKLRQDSLLALTLTHCSQLQTQLTNLYLTYEQTIDTQCLKPIQLVLETDIPNVLKLKKLYAKAHNDLESLRLKYNGASQKQQHQQQQQQTQSGHFTNTSYLVSQNSIQQGSTNKFEQLKNELDEAVTRFEQAKDLYEAELFGFVYQEPELVNLLRMFYQLQSEYHQQVASTLQSSLPALDDTLARTPRKVAFGTPLDEHLRCTSRLISPVIELCTHFLYAQGLKEEGLFRIPGSSVKMKKLKNGINAWLVTLMSLNELEGAQQRQSGHSCIVALYDLFKGSVGQRPQQQSDPSNSSGVIKSNQPDHTTNQRNSLTSDPDHNQQTGHDQYIMDVHSIAGLLKLYLRKLPEPLFTHSLYNDWICCITNKTGDRIDSLAKILKKLPSANYENLKHLIKFLNQLTQFQEQNKMTATNLAIAMAPSLIWPKPPNHGEQHQSDVSNNPDSAQSIDLQISSFGISASQHAMILEALINHADVLFPGPCDFALSEFPNLTLKSNCDTDRDTLSRGSRTVKSTSPTGISTASSSSFSSNASSSTASSLVNKGHSRKGGSMEGLLGGTQNNIKSVLQPNMSTRSIAAKPPPKPPAPASKAYLNQAIDIRTALNSSHKPPAPPVPPPTSTRHQQERLKASTASSSTDNQTDRKPRPVSLRGTGTIDCTPNTSSSTPSAQQSTRPSVPPPQRPNQSLSVSDAKTCDNPDPKNCKSADNDHKGSRSATSNYNIRGDFEEIGANEIEEIKSSTKSNSPVVSLDSISADDDSSFDNEHDNLSLDLSWTKCFATADHESREQRDERSGTLKAVFDTDDTRNQPSDLGHQHQAPPTVKVHLGLDSEIIVDQDRGTKVVVTDRSSHDSHQREESTKVKLAHSAERPTPPVKPPRSASPKIAQSTPL